MLFAPPVLLIAVLSAPAADVDPPRMQAGPPVAPSAALTISSRLAAAEIAHLSRVTVWGTANVMGGIALAGGASGLEAAGIQAQPELFGLGVQSALWGAINLGIVGAGFRFLDQPTEDLAAAIDAEDTWRTVLAVNECFNMGYVAVGALMVGASFLPVPISPLLLAQLRGHGLAVMFQGAGLFILDGLALVETHRRRPLVDAHLDDHAAADAP